MSLESLPITYLERAWSLTRDQWQDKLNNPTLEGFPLQDGMYVTITDSGHIAKNWFMEVGPNPDRDMAALCWSLGTCVLERNLELGPEPEIVESLDPSKSFGMLRALLHKPSWRARDRQLAWQLLSQCYEQNWDVYTQEWVTYVSDFRHHFQEAITMLTTPSSFNNAVVMAPYARFGYHAYTLQDMETLSMSPWTDHVHTLLATDLPLDTSIARETLQCFQELHTLDLSGNGIKEPGLQDLLHHALPKLRDLRLSRVGYGSLTYLSGRRLRHLDVSYGTHPENARYDMIETLTELEHLNLEGCPQPGLEPEHFPTSLTSLNLSYTNMDASFYVEVLQRLPHLEVLELRGVPINLDVLRTCTQLKSLRELDLGFTQVGDRGARILGLAKWSKLEALRLQCAQITEKGVQALVLSCPPSLRELNLGGNIIGSDGLEALSDAWGDVPLESLGLACSGIDECVKPIATWSTSLRCLDVMCNELGSVGATYLATTCRGLEFLNLYHTKFEPRVVGVLCSTDFLPHLRRLHFDGWEESLYEHHDMLNAVNERFSHHEYAELHALE